MDCKETQNRIDDYLDHTLSAEDGRRMASHLNACAACRNRAKEEQSLREQLTMLPIPAVSQGFYARVMREGRQNSPVSGMRMRAVGGVFGAFLVVLVALNVWKPVKNENLPLQTISMQVYETKTVSLAFNSPEDIEGVTFVLQLPEGVELNGRPGQTRLAWTNNLRQGRNVMNLKLKGKEQLQGELIARIEHKGLEREYKVSLKVDGINGAEIDRPVYMSNIS